LFLAVHGVARFLGGFEHLVQVAGVAFLNEAGGRVPLLALIGAQPRVLVVQSESGLHFLSQGLQHILPVMQLVPAEDQTVVLLPDVPVQLNGLVEAAVALQDVFLDLICDVAGRLELDLEVHFGVGLDFLEIQLEDGVRMRAGGGHRTELDILVEAALLRYLVHGCDRDRQADVPLQHMREVCFVLHVGFPVSFLLVVRKRVAFDHLDGLAVLQCHQFGFRRVCALFLQKRFLEVSRSRCGRRIRPLQLPARSGRGVS